MLSRPLRLRKARDFRAVFASRGRMSRQANTVQSVVSNERLTIHIGKRRDFAGAVTKPGLRFGFTISKKVAKRAHDRNRIKRRLSEIARLELVPRYALDANYDCVVIARQGTVTANYELFKGDLLGLLTSAGILKVENFGT